jgi:hypothetical protein
MAKNILENHKRILTLFLHIIYPSSLESCEAGFPERPDGWVDGSEKGDPLFHYTIYHFNDRQRY